MSLSIIDVSEHRQKLFWAKVDKDVDCWNWSGAISTKGYGNFYLPRRKIISAHKYSLLLCNMVPPIGMVVDHTCENKRCVNPTHLEIVTHAENSRRHYERNKREKCPNGHKYTGTEYVNPDGCRKCRICLKFSKRRNRARKMI